MSPRMTEVRRHLGRYRLHFARLNGKGVMRVFFKKKRVTTQASARRVADVSKANWVSKFVDEPGFRIDLGIWARLTRTMIRKGR